MTAALKRSRRNLAALPCASDRGDTTLRPQSRGSAPGLYSIYNGARGAPQGAPSARTAYQGFTRKKMLPAVRRDALQLFRHPP